MTDEEKERILKERREQIEKQFGSEADSHDTISSGRSRKPHICCYKCKAGCFHVEYGNLLITCSEDEFFQLSDVVIQLRNNLLIEQLQKEDEEFVIQGLM